MPIHFAPFAFVRLRDATLAPAGHLLVTPRTVALIRPTSERVFEYRKLVSARSRSVRDALVEYARWPQPLTLEREDELFELASVIAPEATRAELAALSVFSGADADLITSLAAWRVDDLLPPWKALSAVLQARVCDAASPRAIVLQSYHRAPDDALLLTLTGASGVILLTTTVWASCGLVRCWVHHGIGHWTVAAYRLDSDGSWTRQAGPSAPARRFAQVDDVANDLVRGGDRSDNPVIAIRTEHQEPHGWRGGEMLLNRLLARHPI